MVCGIDMRCQTAVNYFTGGKLKLFDTVREMNDSDSKKISLVVDSSSALDIQCDDIKKFDGKVSYEIYQQMLLSSINLLFYR